MRPGGQPGRLVSDRRADAVSNIGSGNRRGVRNRHVPGAETPLPNKRFLIARSWPAGCHRGVTPRSMRSARKVLIPLVGDGPWSSGFRHVPTRHATFRLQGHRSCPAQVGLRCRPNPCGGCCSRPRTWCRAHHGRRYANSTSSVRRRVDTGIPRTGRPVDYAAPPPARCPP